MIRRPGKISVHPSSEFVKDRYDALRRRTPELEVVRNLGGAVHEDIAQQGMVAIDTVQVDLPAGGARAKAVRNQPVLLIRPYEVLSRIANVKVLEVAHDALRVLLQHRHVLVGRLT